MSASADGLSAGNGNSYDPAISSDGEFVAFVSLATNLVTSDALIDGITPQVYVRTLCNPTTSGGVTTTSCTPTTYLVSSARRRHSRGWAKFAALDREQRHVCIFYFVREESWARRAQPGREAGNFRSVGVLRRNRLHADYELDFNAGCGRNSRRRREYRVIDFRRRAVRCICFDGHELDTGRWPAAANLSVRHVHGRCDDRDHLRSEREVGVHRGRKNGSKRIGGIPQHQPLRRGGYAARPGSS